VRSVALCIVGLALLPACVENPFETIEAPCEERGGWYADTDGDGVGDPGSDLWVTCDDPGEGWTDVPPPHTDDTDTDDTDG